MWRFGGLKESEAVVGSGAENFNETLVGGDFLKLEVRIWRIRNINRIIVQWKKNIPLNRGMFQPAWGRNPSQCCCFWIWYKLKKVNSKSQEMVFLFKGWKSVALMEMMFRKQEFRDMESTKIQMKSSPTWNCRNSKWKAKFWKEKCPKEKFRTENFSREKLHQTTRLRC